MLVFFSNQISMIDRCHLLYGISHYVCVISLYCGVSHYRPAGKLASKWGRSKTVWPKAWTPDQNCLGSNPSPATYQYVTWGQAILSLGFSFLICIMGVVLSIRTSGIVYLTHTKVSNVHSSSFLFYFIYI